MSNYRYELGGIIRDLKCDIPYPTDEIVDLLEEKDQRIKELEEENQEVKQSLEHTNKQLDYFTNRFRGREFKRTGDCMKDIELYMKELAIKKLEEVKNYFDDSSDDKYNESEGWIITNRNVVDYVNNQIKSLKGEK